MEYFTSIALRNLCEEKEIALKIRKYNSLAYYTKNLQKRSKKAPPIIDL